jgi:hypothetical protein
MITFLMEDVHSAAFGRNQRERRHRGAEDTEKVKRVLSTDFTD